MYSDRSSNDSRPATPSEEDCCHNACDPCIFDVHKRLLEEYESKKKRNLRSKPSRNILHPSSYRSFIIQDIREACDNYILLSLEYPESEIKSDAGVVMNPGQYVMLHSWKMTRPYTPISWTKRSIVFLIKLYADGKFTSYLSNSQAGDKLDVRGPYGDFSYKCNSFQQVVMFSMGSGIAALYPIAKSIVNDESEETRVHLIGGFQRISQIPLKKELQVLSDYWNFECTLHISQPRGDVHHLHGIKIKAGRLDRGSASEILRDEGTDTTLVLICGTEQFNRSVEEWAKDMSYKHIHVFK